MIRDEYYEFMIKELKKMNNSRSKKFKNSFIQERTLASHACFHVIRDERNYDSKMYIS
jgi:hypothetical protein